MYLQLIREMLASTKMQVVLVDAKGKSEMARFLKKKAGSRRLCNLVGRTSVVELAAVLHGAQGAVGPDCGAGHVASAVHTPYVSLFGPTSPVRTAPFGSEDLVVVAAENECAPCYKRKCPYNRECMQDIDVSQVMDKILQAAKGKKESDAE